MYLMRQVYDPIENLDDMYIYESMGQKWQLSQIIKVRDKKNLIKLLQHIRIKPDYAIIKLNQPYRNTLYYLYPEIKIIIDKEDVILVFNTIMNTQIEAYEEAAALIENQGNTPCFKGVSRYFILDFYNMGSKGEAIEHYELWQTYMPLNDKKISKFIRIMEFYFDEIINYFESPKI